MEQIQAAVDYISKITTEKYQIGIVAGSGLGGLVSCLEIDYELNYSQIPHFPQSTVPGHAGKLVFGKMGDKKVILMLGRVHFYEGNTIEKTAFPIRILKMLGIEILIVTNASGGLNKDYRVGDFMIIKDHISFAGMAGQNPLIGPNMDILGPRFPPISSAYDFELRVLAATVAHKLKIQDTVREGCYTFVTGPSFETRAEARFLRDAVKADCVGMSTVPEVVAAKHAGIKVLGLSLITNKVSVGYGRSALTQARVNLGLEEKVEEVKDDEMALASHGEVLETSKDRSIVFTSWVKEIVNGI